MPNTRSKPPEFYGLLILFEKVSQSKVLRETEWYFISCLWANRRCLMLRNIHGYMCRHLNSLIGGVIDYSNDSYDSYLTGCGRRGGEERETFRSGWNSITIGITFFSFCRWAMCAYSSSQAIQRWLTITVQFRVSMAAQLKTVSRKLRKPLLFQQIDISVDLFSLMLLTAYYSLSSFFHSRIIWTNARIPYFILLLLLLLFPYFIPSPDVFCVLF